VVVVIVGCYEKPKKLIKIDPVVGHQNRPIGPERWGSEKTCAISRDDETGVNWRGRNQYLISKDESRSDAI